MRIFQHKGFRKWAIRQRLGESVFLSTVIEMERGLIGVYLGDSTYKKRLKIGDRGKSAGARAIIAYAADVKTFEKRKRQLNE